MGLTGIILFIVLLAGAALFWRILHLRNMHLWIVSYLRQKWVRRQRSPVGIKHVYFCFADHYEPYWHQADRTVAHQRVQRWVDGYPRVAKGHRDSDGRPPQHSYFYPEEEYDADLLDALAGLCRQGYGDVEVHLHHDNDSAENFRRTMLDFTRTLHERHGFLRRNAAGTLFRYRYARRRNPQSSIAPDRRRPPESDG